MANRSPKRAARAGMVAAVALTTSWIASSVRAQQQPEAADRPADPPVHPYTAPEIAEIFQELDDLKPLPYDQLKRELPPASRGSREELGLMFGSLVADGFLIVECEKKNVVDELGRVLLREARSLGVGDRVMRHSASLTELGRRGDWPAVRNELTATQSDVEHAMVDLKDEKVANLISMGGWLRGLEMCAAAVEADYSPKRAATLWQPDLIHYFAEELKKLPAPVAQSPIFEKLRSSIDAITAVLDHAKPDNMTADEVKAIHARAAEMNNALRRAE